MEQNSIRDNLTKYFQIFTFSDITDDNAQELENFLLSILDSDNNEIFQFSLLYNFLGVLETKELSFLLELLIKEIKTKALRVEYYNCLKQPDIKQNCCQKDEEPPKIDLTTIALPPEGYTIKVKRYYRDSKNNQKVVIYTVNHYGDIVDRAIENASFEMGDDITELNNSPLYNLLEKNLKKEENKLSENDL